MRIIGGRLSGRRFAGPRGDKTRPTAERVREALASALDARGWIEDAAVLELWAGTGALSFEALSRGARHAVLVEGDRRVARSIERSAGELALTDQTTVVVADLEKPPARWLERLEEPVGLVFCDPPYARIERVEPLLAALWKAGKLRPEAAIVVEHAKRSPPSFPPSFGEVARYRYGDTAVLLGTAPEPPEPE